MERTHYKTQHTHTHTQKRESHIHVAKTTGTERTCCVCVLEINCELQKWIVKVTLIAAEAQLLYLPPLLTIITLIKVTHSDVITTERVKGHHSTFQKDWTTHKNLTTGLRFFHHL